MDGGVTNHHPNCQHYNDSLIDVWTVILGGVTYICDNERDALDTVVDEYDLQGIAITINKTKMHLEVYEQLPEFEGF